MTRCVFYYLGIWQLGEEAQAKAFGGFKPGDIKVADMSPKGSEGEGVFSTDDRVIFFASISGYQNVGAATTIAVLVASQLIGGLVLDIFRSHGVPLRALIGPICGAILLVVGAWLVARRSF